MENMTSGFQNVCLLQVSIWDWSKDSFPLNDDIEMFAYSNYLPPPQDTGHSSWRQNKHPNPFHSIL